MKRKYLSALLMGTLTVASMSTFTSCKDYDDDISNLQEQIDKLATADQLSQKVSELQALISSNQSGISSLQAELAKKTTLDEVKAVLANYATNENVTKEANEIVNAAIKALQDKDIAELKTAIEAAQKTADQAVKDAADAKAEILKTLEDYALKSDVDAVRDAANTAIAAVKSENTQAINAAKTEILEKLQDYATKEALNGVAEAAKAAVEAAKADNATKLAEAVSALETKITAAQNTADEAKTKAGENAAAILALANTTTTANNALAQANANKTAIENALKTLGTGFSEQNTVAAAIQAINGQLTAKNTGLSGLDGRLSAIEVALRNNESESVPALNVKVNAIQDKLKDIIGQYSTMVTDVQLYNFAGYNGNVNGSYHGGAYIPNGYEYGESWGEINGSAAPSVVPGWNTTLQFVQAAEKANVFPAQAGIATEQLKFEEGKYYAGEDSLLIRVSPVDAELTTSNVSLMNSQGKELDDIIDVTDVHRFKGLLTRASSANTGLWVVKFKATDLGDKFKEAAVVDSKKVLYAVAVKNTYNTTGEEKDANTRRVTSEFGVDLSTSDAQHAWDFDVNTKSVANIRNRYYLTETGTPTDKVTELVWKDEAATTVVTDNEDDTKNNAVNRPSWSDNRKDCRQWKNILAVEKGKDITIDFSNTELKGVKGFYVTLDEAFAKESAPSELNAWNSYTYKGVGYHKNGGAYVPAELFKGSKGTIRIENLGNVQGDVIGFRVYAVNYDGTLYDPDGRSFYVAVGDVKTEMPLANAKAELDMATPTQFVSNLIDADFSKVDFDGSTTWKISEKDVADNIPSWGDFTVKYFDKDKHEKTSLGKDVKYIQFVLNHPQAFVDGETYNASMTLTKNISGATAEACNVTASFTKVMPTAAPTFCYRDGYSKTPEYIIPEGGDYTVGSDNKGGTFKLNNLLIIDNNNTWKGADLFEASTAGKFSFNVSNGTYDAEKKNVVSAKADAPYELKVVNGKNNLVDNKTERTIAANYIYYDISKQYNKETKQYEPVHEYPVPSASEVKIVYCSWMKTLAVKTALKSTWTGTKGDGDGKNVVTWKATGDGGADLDLANLQTEISDLKLLPAGALIANGKSFGGLIDANVVEVVNGKYGEVYTTDKNNTQINPHFSAKFVGPKIVLTQREESTIAPSTTAGNIHFTVKDCFGNTKEIVLPFYIKK